MNELIRLDQTLMLQLNGSDSIYMDGVMKLFSSTWVWMPLALAIIFILIKNNSLRGFIFLAFMIALTVFVCDRVSSGIIKPWVGRLRPCQDPTLLDQIDIVNGSRSGKYGFISSHAANTFGLFMFFALLFKHKVFGASLFIWAAVDSFSRIYLGVHYPGDILCGALFGMLVGLGFYYFYSFIHSRLDFSPSKITKYYTASGYSVEDIDFLTFLLYATYVFIVLYTFIFIYIKFY